MEKIEFTTHTAEETMQLAERLASLLSAGDVLSLEGDLGAGKTTFTKGIGKGLGVSRIINSPTFTIVKEYMGKMPLYHMDVYRLENSDEDIGFDTYFQGDGVTIVEWAKFVEEFLPYERLHIDIRRKSEMEREIVFWPKGLHYESICKELTQ